MGNGNIKVSPLWHGLYFSCLYLLSVIENTYQKWSISRVEVFQETVEFENVREDLNYCFSIFLLGFKLNIF